MKILAERIIEVLKADTTLVSLLGSSDNIFIASAPVRKNKYVLVSTEAGDDLNNIPADEGVIRVVVVVSRKVENAHSVCIDIMDRVDELINKKENTLSNTDWTVLHIIREDSSGLNMDNETGEYWYSNSYRYIITND